MTDYELDDEDPDIIIRRIEPLPRGMSKDFEWGKGQGLYHVELYSDASWPEGMATVVDYSQMPGDMLTTPWLKYLFVIDQERRQGYGTRILKACLKRWPNIEYSGASEAGILLVAKVTGEEVDPGELADARFAVTKRRLLESRNPHGQN